MTADLPHDKPFFSILIPTFNRAALLKEAINSILSQDFIDWELIVIDDGSRDGTREVVEGFYDKRIRYFFQENSERGASRNHGIREAKGNYICFLDSDDLYQPAHLKLLYNFLIERSLPVALIFANCLYLSDGHIVRPELPSLRQSPITYFLLNPVIPSRVCIHGEILKKHRFREDITIVEDTFLWVTIANEFEVLHLPQYSVVYRMHEGRSVDISKNCFLPRLKGLLILFKEKCLSNKIPFLLKMLLISDCYFGIARYYEFKRKFIPMALNIFISFAFQPLHRQNKSKIYKLLFFYRGGLK